jgi:gluconolactonase
MTLNSFPINADGSLGKKRVLVDFGQDLGIDGMTVDLEGNIYAAVRTANRFGIVVFTPEGKERAYIPTPDLPTNCCFGAGREASTLYVTAAKGLYRIGLAVAGYEPARGE